jgi:hypothetical protein
MPHNTLWWVALAVTVLVFFGALGIAHVLNPDCFIKRSGLRKGGELLTEWNRLGVQIAGAILTILAIWVLWDVLRH